MPTLRAHIIATTLVAIALGLAAPEAAQAASGKGSPFRASPPAYQQYPAQTTVPTAPTPPKVTKPPETRGKYSNPYDRKVPLQGDTHKEYTGGGRDPYKRY